MKPKEIKRILSEYKVITVVGLSGDATKPSHDVAAYMKKHGYKIIPVNPNVDAALGEKSYKSLLDMPEELQKTIEIVDIFRRPEDVPPIVDQVVQLKKKYGKPLAIWMQLGIVNEQAAKAAEEAGLMVVMDKCIMIEHKRLC